jgi:cell division control protein 6
VIDEVDRLATSNMEQSVLYQLFSWAAEQPKSRLVLIGIANSIDLTQRLLPNLERTNVKVTLIDFVAYSKTQMESIVRSRLKQDGEEEEEEEERKRRGKVDPSLLLRFVQEQAISFCCAKVQNSSGDLRHCLRVLSLAVDRLLDSQTEEVRDSPLVFQEPPPLEDGGERGRDEDRRKPKVMLSLPHVSSALTPHSADFERILKLPTHQKIVLAALVLLNRKALALSAATMASAPATKGKGGGRGIVRAKPGKGGVPCLVAGSGRDEYKSVCKQIGMEALDSSQVTELLSSLISGGFVSIVKASGRGGGSSSSSLTATTPIQLVVRDADAAEALEEGFPLLKSLFS